MYKVHDGCSFKIEELVAVWSEKYSDPKLDQECYLVRTFFKNNSTILTIANFSCKSEADELIQKLTDTTKNNKNSNEKCEKKCYNKVPCQRKNNGRKK